MKLIFVVLLLFSIVVSGTAQDEIVPSVDSNIGFGVGLDYGGLGSRISIGLYKHLSVLTGVGYNWRDIGFNVGLQYQVLTTGRLRPNVMATYGYNGVLKKTGNHPRFDRTYYGPSVGGSLEIHGKNDYGNFINVGVMLPFRSQEYRDAVDHAKADFNKPLPVVFSVGYHFAIGY